MSVPSAPSHPAASGLPGIGDLAWGSHVCQFFSSRQDLVDTLVPFFRAGLDGNERCLWIADDPLPPAAARAALAAAVPDLDRFEASGQIELLAPGEWTRRAGSADGDGLVDAWRRQEDEALARGFAGLRVSGDAAALAPSTWRALADDEAAVHRDRARRIVAVCRYGLDGLAPERLLEVLRHHDRVLVPRDGRPAVLHSATTLLAEAGAPERPADAGHAVCFHDAEYEAPEIAAFLARRLDAGDGLLVVVTPEHGRAIAAALAARGIDAAALAAEGRLVEADAGAVAAATTVLSAGRDLLREHLGAAMDGLAARHGGFAVYGEIVDLLALAGRVEAAVALEGAWNELLAGYPARLLCGYHLAAFDHDSGGGDLGRVCDAHSKVIAAGAPAAGDPHHDLALRRKSRLAREATHQLARLQAVTAALSEAVTLDEVAAVVAGEVARAAGAVHAGLALDGEAALAAPPGAADDPLARRAAALAGGEPLWLIGRAAIDARLGAAAAPGLEAVAGLPLAAGGARCGTLALGFRAARAFSLAERALAEDVARQVAIAVDRARLFHRAESARLEAERASRAKDEFLAMLGHELRNPLAPIVTALHLIKLRDDGRLERERAVLDRQVSHLHRLVEDLLDVSRITHGKLQIERRPIELSEAVAQALETTAPLFEQRGHRLSVEVPASGLVVAGDRGRLAQVVGNLLTNAAKYTPPGGEVAVSAEAAGGEVVLSIRDSGIGMAPELAATVFDTFVQAGRPAEAGGGLGLGLAIVRGLVESHGGRVAAASDGHGRGCTMTVRLPRAAGHRELELVHAPAPAAPAAAGVSVLIVDDNVDAAEALGELGRLLGCDCRLAHDGPSALLAAEALRPDLVLLDLGLPVMSGHEVAGHLRALPGGDAMHIVAVTGFGQPADRERSRLAGCDDHWVKPLDPEALSALVDELSRTREDAVSA